MNIMETLEKAAERLYPTTFVAIYKLRDKVDKNKERRQIFIEGAKSDAAKDYWFNIFKQENIYSEEEVLKGKDAEKKSKIFYQEKV